MFLKIKTNSKEIFEYYKNHTSYHPNDSGLDLFIINDITIKAGELSKKINLGISCEAFLTNESNNNCSYYLYPRSSIVKTPLRLSNSVGIIDAGYRGDIIAVVDNLDRENDYHITSGTRLFQLCSPILSPITFVLVSNLSDTSRGDHGFGSTG